LAKPLCDELLVLFVSLKSPKLQCHALDIFGKPFKSSGLSSWFHNYYDKKLLNIEQNSHWKNILIKNRIYREI